MRRRIRASLKLLAISRIQSRAAKLLDSASHQNCIGLGVTASQRTRFESLSKKGPAVGSSSKAKQGKRTSKATLATGSGELSVLSGGGEMGARTRAFDWSQTPLGPVEKWPQSLKTSVSICLASQFPIVLYWGPEYVVLYNDAYSQILGTKHPWALGQTCRTCWAEIWDTIGPMLDGVVRTGKATWSNDLLLMLQRFGYPEECYFSFSFSPVQVELGRVGGIFTAVIETTEKVIGERRLKTLRDLAAGAVAAKSEQDAWQIAANTLSENRKDVPFAILCRAAEDTLQLAGAAGISLTHPLCRELCDAESTLFQKAIQVSRSGTYIELKDFAADGEDLPKGLWEVAPRTALLLPLAALGQGPSGVLLAATSPAKALDDSYSAFFELVARQIATSIADTRAYEEQRKRAEALAELDRAKTAFFSNVSHEFRTPLTLILGPLEDVLPEARDRLSPKHQQHLLAVRRNAVRLLKLVNTLLDFSSIESGRVQAVYEPTDVCRLTEDISSAFRSAIERAGLGFTIACETIDEPVYVDRAMWEKIVLNLLSNAFKFTFQGEIAVILKLADKAVELAVRDTGVGISAAEQSRVFERFHRIENTRARTYEGSGIGLALVEELVRLHGGAVRLESSPGRGSTFTVSIPLGKAHLPADRIGAKRTSVSTAVGTDAYVDEAERWLPEDGQAATGQPNASKPLTTASPVLSTQQSELIVVADDNADMRDYLAHLLGGEYRVHAVTDGLQAVQATRELHPSLVLADVMMPGLDGFGVLNAIRRDASINSTPVILLSARAGEESRVEGLHGGADDYLVKPFTARELIARVSTHIKMAKLRSEAAEREARLRAEAERERHRLQELLAQAPAAIGLLAGPEHRWTYVNEQYVRVTGRSSASDFVGKTIRESLPEIETQPFIDLLDEVYRTGKPYVGREVAARLNRSHTGQSPEAYFDFVYQPETNADGSVEGILIHAVEVTDKVMARKVAEQRERALRESEQRFRVITDATPVLVWMSGTDKLCTYFNRSWLDFVGRTLEQELGNGWAENVHPDDVERCLQIYVSSFDNRQPFEMEYRLRHRSGQYRWILDRGVPRYAPDGTFEGYVGGCLDIHEQKDATQKLQIALVGSQRLAAIVESSNDAIMSKDLNGIVTSWNPAAERMFGYTAEEMIGHSIRTLIPLELQDEEDRILATVGSGETIEHFETVRITKSGECIDVSLTISPVRDETGSIVGVAKIARDVTEQKRTEHALRMSERLASVGRLAATVAHEINNPLEAITNLLYLAKERTLRDDVREFLAQAEEELNRVSHLTKQTLGFYRETKAPNVVKVGGLVTSLISIFAPRCRNKGVDIFPEVEDDARLFAVPGEIRQIIANLLSNSIDAVQPGGSIRIRVSSARTARGRDGVRVTVADSGHGIPPKVRSRIFEPFFTTKKDVGTGLGLWVCKSIVDKHRGTIRVKSCAKPGRCWTAFSVFLPSLQAESVEDALRQVV